MALLEKLALPWLWEWLRQVTQAYSFRASLSPQVSARAVGNSQQITNRLTGREPVKLQFRTQLPGIRTR